MKLNLSSFIPSLAKGQNSQESNEMARAQHVGQSNGYVSKDKLVNEKNAKKRNTLLGKESRSHALSLKLAREVPNAKNG